MEKLITTKQALEMIEVMNEINQINFEVNTVYLASLDFLESKGLKKEFDEFLTIRKRIN